MEDISGATAASTASAPKRDSALLNQSLDDIIKQNRTQRRNEKKSQPGRKTGQPASKPQNQSRNRDRNDKKKKNNNNKMMDTTPVRTNQVQKQRGQQRDNSRGGNRGKLVVRANSGRPTFDRNDRNDRNKRVSAPSTPGLRQPWEKLPTAPLPAEPLKISIRNELADRPVRRPDTMMDTDHPIASTSSYRPAYEPRDALASRDEYRIGNRFATQGMAIDYQLPSGASYDTRPTRRY